MSATGIVVSVTDIRERFFAKTKELPNGCLEWTRYRDEDGYGRFSVGGAADNKMRRAHVVFYEWEHGPVPDGLVLDHYLYPDGGCIGPACVRHTRPVTRRENTYRGDAPSAWRAGMERCGQGHPFTPENTYVDPDGSGRECKTCRRAWRAAYRARKRAV